MSTLTPAIPTDSLYKFIALFGLVLFGFGFFFPDKKVAQASAEARLSDKARQLAKIRLDRKSIQNGKMAEEWELRSVALTEKQKLLDNAKSALDAKRQSLSEELARMDSKTPVHDVKEAQRVATALKSDIQALDENVRQYSNEVHKLVEDYKPVQARGEEFADEMAVEAVNLKADTAALEEQTEQIKWWTFVMCASVLIGLGMICAGFRLWYVKIQVHQDAILREQAARKSVASASE